MLGTLPAKDGITKVVEPCDAANAGKKDLWVRIVKKHMGDALLIDVRHVQGRLQVLQIIQGGAVDRCNREALARQPPEETLQLGDAIVRINDATDDESMVKESGEKLVLELLIS